jgi:hypothetical protein
MKLHESKFSEGQHVIVLNMLVNDERVDFGGFVVNWGRGKSVQHLIEVKVNGVSLHFEEKRLVDYQEYWLAKNLTLPENK